MQPSARRTFSPYERKVAARRHPTGRARRRWPRAYDGGIADPGVSERYRDDFDGDRQQHDRRRTDRRRTALEGLRQSPLRNGLIGLAVAGTAAPIAVNRYQQAMRTDPNHEEILASATGADPISDSNVARAWEAMEGERSAAVNVREQTIQDKLEENSNFGLTRQLAEEIYDMASGAGIDMDVAYGLVRAESSFKNTATSRVGAVGLTQLMPSTARWLEPGITRGELRDSKTNLRIGFGYLKQLIEKYDGNENLALVAYNRGPGTVDRVLKRGGNPDNGYADFVRTGDVGNHKG